MSLSINSPQQSERGFTLIEILVVIGVLAILTTIVLVAVNPGRQFAQARNTQRHANVAAILNAVSNRVVDHRGVFEGSLWDTCDSLPTTTQQISSEAHDLRKCLVPTYVPELPYDPVDGFNNCSSVACPEEYVTEYTIVQHPQTKQVTICAPKAQDETAVGDGNPICVTR